MAGKRIIHRLLVVVLMGISALSLSACNTVKGAGKDVKAGGQAVQDAAEDAQH